MEVRGCGRRTRGAASSRHETIILEPPRRTAAAPCAGPVERRGAVAITIPAAALVPLLVQNHARKIHAVPPCRLAGRRKKPPRRGTPRVQQG